MKKYSLMLVFIFMLQNLLFNGCSYDNQKPQEVNKITENSEPSKLEHEYDGIFAEIDGDVIAVNTPKGIQLFDLNSNKLIKEIPESGNGNIFGYDISGDIVTWDDINAGSPENEPIDPNNEDIYIYNYKTNEQKQVTKDKWSQKNPKIWKNYIIWQDNRNGITKEYPGEWSLYLYDLTTGTEKKIASNLASLANYNISDDIIVWEDERNNKWESGGQNVPQNNKDIFMYDIKTGIETAIATGPYMESSPDVYGDYIVWEDRNNNTLDADIVLYNLKSQERIYITKDKVNQGTPRIYNGNIVWMDERRGISTNDVMINGKEPNSDILICNIKNKTERILTGDGPQIQPCISDKWIGFVLSSQVNPKVQVIKY